ncbi:MAG: type II toxin-antitoxin system ParD family antitoxin [Thermomicrobiales bacterium]
MEPIICAEAPVLATILLGGITPMPIQLTPEAEAVIREKVTSGLYANPEEAIDAAVRLLEEHDRLLERLRAAIAAGEEGEALPWTPALMEQLTREAEEMRRRGETPHPDVCP